MNGGGAKSGGNGGRRPVGTSDVFEGGEMEETAENVQVGSPDGTTMPNTLEYDAEAFAFAIASPVCPPEFTD